MTISGLNRGAPKDIMNGLSSARWLPPPAAGCNARRGRRKRSSTHPLCCARPVAPHLATQLLPYSQGQAAHCELRCAARSPPADGHAVRLGLPKPTDTMDPLHHTTGKPAAAFNGLMGGGGHCKNRRKARKLPERKNAHSAFAHRSARLQPLTSLLNTTTQPPPPHSPD